MEKSQINILEVLQMMFDYKAILKSSEVAGALGVSSGTLSNLVKENKIPYLKFGESKTSSIRFDIVAIAKWIESSMKVKK